MLYKNYEYLFLNGFIVVLILKKKIIRASYFDLNDSIFLQLWDIRDGMCKQTFSGHESDINAITVSIEIMMEGNPCFINLELYEESSYKNSF